MNTDELNYYGNPIIEPAQFDRRHDVAYCPPIAGMPPVCTCGWTRFRGADGTWIELWQHLADQREYDEATFGKVK